MRGAASYDYGRCVQSLIGELPDQISYRKLLLQKITRFSKRGCHSESVIPLCFCEAVLPQIEKKKNARDSGPFVVQIQRWLLDTVELGAAARRPAPVARPAPVPVSLRRETPSLADPPYLIGPYSENGLRGRRCALGPLRRNATALYATPTAAQSSAVIAWSGNFLVVLTGNPFWVPYTFCSGPPAVYWRLLYWPFQCI